MVELCHECIAFERLNINAWLSEGRFGRAHSAAVGIGSSPVMNERMHAQRRLDSFLETKRPKGRMTIVLTLRVKTNTEALILKKELPMKSLTRLLKVCPQSASRPRSVHGLPAFVSVARNSIRRFVKRRWCRTVALKPGSPGPGLPRRSWPLVLAGVLILTLTTQARAAVTSLLVNSEPGDPVGGGQLFFFAPSNGTFTVQESSTNSVTIAFQSSPFDHYFYMTFTAPQGQRLNVGNYAGAMGVSGPSVPGLYVYGNGNACSTVTGSFDVKQVSFGADGQLNAFWATFEQHCNGATPSLFGDIRFNANVPVVVSAPVSVLVAEGATLRFAVRASEILNRHVTLSASNLPSGASFVDNGNNTGSFSWTLSTGLAGAYTVTFYGDNGLGATDSAPARITVTIPGDDFSNAAIITSLPYTNILDTSEATRASDDPSACYFQGHTVWYAFTPPNSLRIAAAPFGTHSPTILSVFTGPRGALTQLVCNDNSGGLLSQVIFDAVAGRTYYFMVGASGGSAGGSLMFSVNGLVAPPNDDFNDATRIPSVPYTNLLSATAALASSDDPSACSFARHTVWDA